MRCTELVLMEQAADTAAAVQCVVSPGGSVNVRATTRSMTASSSGGMREGRVLSTSSPSAPAFHEALLPAPDAGLGRASGTPDLVRANAVRRQQDNLHAPDVLLWAVAIRRDLNETGAVRWTEPDGDTSEHPADSHATSSKGIPNGTLPSGSVH